MKLLIMANGLDVKGGIGNCLYKMINVLLEDSDILIELLLQDVEYANKLFKNNERVKITKSKSKISLNQSLMGLIKDELKRHDYIGAIKAIVCRILYKFDYKLPLFNFTAENIEKLTEYYDVAISYSVIPNFMATYVANSVKASKKIVWAHTDIDQENIKKIKGFSTSKIRGLRSYTKILKKYDQIVTVSDGIGDSIRREFPNLTIPIQTILNIRDRQHIQKMSVKNAVELNYTGFKILTVGRLSNEKGINLAVETISNLKKKGINFHWYFLGENLMPDYVKNIIKTEKLDSFITYLGYTDNPYPYFLACDLYVHTSYIEGYCTAIEEARMLGKAVVTTDVAGAKEQIVSGENGFIVPKDAKALCEAIEYMYEHPVEKKKFERNAEIKDYSNDESIRKLKVLIK